MHETGYLKRWRESCVMYRMCSAIFPTQTDSLCGYNFLGVGDEIEVAGVDLVGRVTWSDGFREKSVRDFPPRDVFLVKLST